MLLLQCLIGKYPENTGGSEIKEMKVVGEIQLNNINGSASGKVRWKGQWEIGVEVVNGVST